MIDLRPTIDRIYSLLNEDTDASITYAALEARLALEKVCYDRLRQRHDYISHAELLKWQPGAVVNKLIQDVDQNVAQTMILSMAKNPAVEGVKPDDEDYIEIGTQIGFDPMRIAKMWNALAKLALHVRLPTDRNDHIPEHGDKEKISAKVRQVITELERLANGTMDISGLGEQVSFVCSCGEKNKRLSKLLREGQHIHCINPECKYTWKMVRDGDNFGFESVTFSVNCEQCTAANETPRRVFINMKYDELGSFSCHTCKHKNYVQWWLRQVRPNPAPTSAK